MKLQKVKVAKNKIREDTKYPITRGCFDSVGIHVPSLHLVLSWHSCCSHSVNHNGLAWKTSLLGSCRVSTLLDSGPQCGYYLPLHLLRLQVSLWCSSMGAFRYVGGDYQCLYFVFTVGCSSCFSAVFLWWLGSSLV